MPLPQKHPALVRYDCLLNVLLVLHHQGITSGEFHDGILEQMRGAWQEWTAALLTPSEN